MKTLFLVMAIFLAAAPICAQSDAVQITGGKMFVSRALPQTEPTELISANFTSVGKIIRVPESHWAIVCSYIECQPGGTFTSPGGAYRTFDLREIYSRGNFTINGTTYENVFYSGSFRLDDHTFSIPQIARKKGLMFFQAPFKLDGHLLVCKIDTFASGCPADKLVYEGDIYGHGTMRITMRIKFSAVSDLRTFIQPENFVYQFEP